MSDAQGAPKAGGVRQEKVREDERDLRLDRWFKRRFPALGHGRLEKLLRTGQVRLDGKRCDAGDRVSPGQIVRVPPLGAEGSGGKPAGPAPVDPALAKQLLAAVLHRDEHVIALNKPAGLATQGGTDTRRHVDGGLDALRFGSEERPRLVHRLDRDTSGLLLLGRTARAASQLAAAFRERDSEKVYWAIVVGVPAGDGGRIDLALRKTAQGAKGRETMQVDEEEGERAITDWRLLDRAGRRAALLELRPLTGRTHQLRVHCAAIGAPILGDFKYGSDKVEIDGAPKGLMLHARALRLPHPATGRPLELEAPLPPHFEDALKTFGLDPRG